MEITFKAENGHCPYFIYENTRFYIQDEKQSDQWEYSLCSMKLEKHVYNFKTIEEATEFLDNIKAHLEARFSASELWKTKTHIYSLQKDKNNIKITERLDYKQESGWFDSYLDCLKWSKEYVAKIIKASEPEQLMMSI